MKIWISLLFALIVRITIAQNYLIGGLSFFSNHGSVSNVTSTTLLDSTTIGFNAITSKSLLFVKGKITFDNAVHPDTFFLHGPFTLYAKVGTGALTRLWNYTGANLIPVSIPALLNDTVGFKFTVPGDSLLVSGVPFVVNQLNFWGKPVSAANNSLLALGGQLAFTQNGAYESLIYDFTPGQKVAMDENGYSAAAFLGEIISSTFTIGKSSYAAYHSSFSYAPSENRFYFSDTISVSYLASSIGSDMEIVPADGTGLVFENGVAKWLGKYRILNYFYLDIENVVYPQELYLQYYAGLQGLGIWGTFLLTSLNDMAKPDVNAVAVTAGDSINPGIKLVQDKLLAFSIPVTASFPLNGFTIVPQSGFALTYDPAPEEGRGIVFKGKILGHFADTVNALNIKDPVNAVITIEAGYTGVNNQFTLATTGNARFSIQGLLYRSLNCSLTYGYAHYQFDFYSNTTYANPGGDSTLVTLTQPLVLTDNGTSSTIIRVDGQKFAPPGLSISIISGSYGYDPTLGKTTMTGLAKFEIGSYSFNATLGDAAHAGITLVDGKVQDIDVLVNKTFVFNNMTFMASNVTFQYDRTNSRYVMFGVLSVKLEDVNVTGDLGTAQQPGIVFQNGTLTHLNIAVNSDIHMSKLEFQTQSLGLKYIDTLNTKKYIIHGTVKVKELWSVSATLGNPADANSGLEVKINADGSTKVVLDAFNIQATNVNLEGITFKEVDVKFNDDGQNGYTIDADAKAVFPAGFEIDGEIAFMDQSGVFILNQVNLNYMALGDNEGLEIPGTGVAIVQLGGGIKRVLLDNSETYQFTGQVGLDFGGQFMIGSTEVQMIHLDGNCTIDKDHLWVNDQVYVAAYKSGNNWDGILGKGTATIDLNWSLGIYTVTGTIAFPSDPYVTMKGAALYKSTGLMDAELTVGLVVPKSVPLIGGDHFASVSGAIRYTEKDLSSSWAAGWLDIHYWFFGSHHKEFGIKYAFHPSHVSTIGSGSVSALTSELKGDGLGKNGFGKQASKRAATTQFVLDGQSHVAFIKITPGKPVDPSKLNISIAGPTTTTPVIRYIYRPDSTHFEDAGTLAQLDSLYTGPVPYYITSINQMSGDSSDPLTQGEYTVTFTIEQDVPDSSFGIVAEVMQSYLAPNCSIQVQNTSPVIAPFDSLNLEISHEVFVINDTLQPKLHLFYDHDGVGYDGYLFGTYDVLPGKTNQVNLAPFADSVVYAYDTTYTGTDTIVTNLKRPVYGSNNTCCLIFNSSKSINVKNFGTSKLLLHHNKKYCLLLLDQ